jgi:hypothetical protein
MPPLGPTVLLGTVSCSGRKLPPISYSVNRQGAIGIRVLLTESIADAGSLVPFYFQPGRLRYISAGTPSSIP